MSFLELPWWVYLSLVCSFFGVCMGLNYLVKKFNEARIEERLIRMLQKASTTQSTQVTGPLITVETSGAAMLNNFKTIQQPSPPGISLVFNREENKRRSDPYSLIKPIIPRLSMENINNISPIERTVNSVPLKRIESAQVIAKANSSHIVTEKVFVKTNELGKQAVKKASSSATSDCYVTQRITVKKNEYGHVSGLGTYSVARTRSNTSEFDSEIENLNITAIESIPSIYVQDERAIESVARTESGGKPEETDPKETIDVTEEVLLQNIYTSRIIRTKTSIVDITVEKQGVNDKKSNEEIDTGCFIKASIESFISKIASNLKNKNEDPKIDKSVADTVIAAKQSSSYTGSGRKVTEISSTENKEFRCNSAKENSYPADIDNVGENFPLKKNESQYIKHTSSNSKSNRGEEHNESEHPVEKKSSFYSRIGRVDENISIKKVESGHIAAKKPTSTRSFERVGEKIPVKKVESRHTAIKKTTSAHSQDARLGENIPVKQVESGHTAPKQTTSVYSFERVEENIPVKKVESKHITTKETTSTHPHSARAEDNNVESGHFDTKESSSTHSHNERVVDSIPVKNIESRHTAPKETNSTDSHIECAVHDIPIKMVELGHVATKETASVHSLERVGGNILVKQVESEHIAGKETILNTGITPSKTELVSVKKSVTLIESRRGDSEKPSCILPTNYKTREYADIKKMDSGRKTKETVPHTQSNPIVTAPGPNEEDATGRNGAKASPFHIHSGITVRKQGIKKQKATPIATKKTLNTRIDDNLAESSVVKMSNAARNAIEAKNSKELVLENKKEDIASDNTIQETKDSTVLSGTSKATDDPEEEEEPIKSLTDKIKELLEDEDIVDIKLFKPNPSSKK